MHATIDVRFAVSIDEDRTIPLATLAEFITDQDIEVDVPNAVAADKLEDEDGDNWVVPP